MEKKVSDRADYEEIISHLQIIHTWAEVDWECGYVSIINPKCCEDIVKWIDDALELLKEQENQLTMKYEEGFHDGYKQAMRESVPCYECQEFSCDDCKFKDNRTVKWE